LYGWGVGSKGGAELWALWDKAGKEQYGLLFPM